MEEQIDVLMATYNGEKYLKEQIDSILNQTYKNIRLIISDDNSKDSTREILKEYEKKDNRIKVYYQDKNLGCIGNFEFLLKKVENELYMLSDQDDVWLPEKIKKSYEKLISEKADLVFGDLEVVNEKLEPIYPSFNEYLKINRKIEKYISSNKINYLYNCVTGCTIMARKKWLDKILPLPNKSKYLLHDYWISLITSLWGKIAYMPEKYIKYRQHSNNEVGIRRISQTLEDMNQIRDSFIEIKLGIFKGYVENNDKFPNDLQELNKKAYDYFKMIKNKKNFNFKNWKTFHKLYKTETFMYYIKNFIIMNLPWIGRILFKIKKIIGG